MSGSGRLLGAAELEASAVVANSAMNRERGLDGTKGYARELVHQPARRVAVYRPVGPGAGDDPLAVIGQYAEMGYRVTILVTPTGRRSPRPRRWSTPPCPGTASSALWCCVRAG